ncbi:nucleotidyltransferase family protein [Dokdonella immobilis]|uniref:nucleotidyltransferase family protein n=1 Tax=Dokdonella immobilis TaxID=578942 RepID=UPI000B826837
MPSIEELGKIVHDWAATQPRVSAAYLFGSRVRGTSRENSDLDVAVEILSPKGLPGNFCDWAGLADGQRDSLGALLPVSLDLTQYENPKDTPVVHKGLCSGSLLVYSMGPNNSFKPTPLGGAA